VSFHWDAGLREHDLRPANAVDFWRGFALITIFINHVPGIYYERFTHRNVSFSDSADLFVFLAGWALRLVAGPVNNPAPLRSVLARLGGRVVAIYAAQILIISIAIAMLAASAKLLDNPLLLEWHNAAPVFYDPVNAHIGLIILTHHLGYFDILPLYVVLMSMALVIVPIHRYFPNALLPLSLALYFTALVFQLGLPSWPNRGLWFFNPLAWQLTFVLGFSMAREFGPGAFVRRHITAIRIIAAPIVLAAAAIVWFDLWWDYTKMPQPRLLFVVGKSFDTPLRVIQFLAWIAVFSMLYPTIERWLPRLVTVLSQLGRNSLYVFCVGSILSLLGQIVRFVFKGGLMIDTVIAVVGIGLLALTGWLAEIRETRKGTAS
jgi:hypothetical protein